MTTFKDYSVHESVRRQVADHELFLSFTDDDGAIAFQEWLASEGMKRFNQWLLKSDYAHLHNKED